MMGQQEITSILKRCRYKLETVFETYVPFGVMPPDVIGVRITQSVRDVHPPYEHTKVCRNFSLKPIDLDGMTERMFVNRLYKELTKMEEHEQQEWFRIDGQPFVEPHPEHRGNSRTWGIAPPMEVRHSAGERSVNPFQEAPRKWDWDFERDRRFR